MIKLKNIIFFQVLIAGMRAINAGK